MTTPARGNQTYPPSRGRCTCSHVEIAHELRRDKTRGKCSVTDYYGGTANRVDYGPPTPCPCPRYQEVDRG